MTERAPPDEPEGDPLDPIRPVERRRVGRYELVASLGRGGAGEVFLALSKGPGGVQKLVVVKMLHPHLQEDPRVVAMFLDEARLAAKLKHPNIVQTLQVGSDDEGRHFIAMTFLEGLPLHRILARFGQRDERMPPEIAVRIATEVLAGLAYAHELQEPDGTPLQIVHRDVSPANVFVTWDGSVKLLDFGIAKAARRRVDTDSGTIKGKFGYIAPEQASSDDVDARTDLWSVGVLLWEMLTGQRLFPRHNDVRTLRLLVEGDIPSLRHNAPTLPPPLASIVDKALERDRSQRWASAKAMKAALEEWLHTLEREVTRDDVAACIGDRFSGVRGRQQEIVRLCAGAPRLTSTPSGSFAVRDETSRKLATLPPPQTPPVRPPRAPLVLAAAVCAALGAIVGSAALDCGPSAERRVAPPIPPTAPTARLDAGGPAPHPPPAARTSEPTAPGMGSPASEPSGGLRRQ